MAAPTLSNSKLKGLEPWHSYSVFGIYRKREDLQTSTCTICTVGTTLVKLRNPWGKPE